MGQRGHKGVLFLCTGNSYRSRFAEILFNSVAGRMNLTWKAMSRGLALERGVNNVGPMDASAVKALEAQGVRAAEDMTRFPAGDRGRPQTRRLDRSFEADRTPAAASSALSNLGREGRILAGG